MSCMQTLDCVPNIPSPTDGPSATSTSGVRVLFAQLNALGQLTAGLGTAVAQH